MNEIPYKGLMPYEEGDAPYFFGRERERELIIANLMASRLTLLYGASGVGKSSVLHAGVANHLRQLAAQNVARRGKTRFAVIVFNSWRDDPIEGLSQRIKESVSQTLQEPPPSGATSSRNLVRIAHYWARQMSGDLLIILDQFEEYFLYHANEDGPGTFAFELPHAVNCPRLRVHFLISIREDALAKLDRFKGQIPSLFENYLRIDYLDRNAAKSAIEKPIEHYNSRHPDEQPVIPQPELVNAVLKQIKTGQVRLSGVGQGVIETETKQSTATTHIETPYLQMVMTRLWSEEMKKGSRQLRLETLDILGGAEQIVKEHLDASMNELSANHQAVAAKFFHYLVTPSGTKIAHKVSDLADYTGLPQKEISEVIEKLSEGTERILRSVNLPSEEENVSRYEIFHDVLAAAILDWRARYLQRQARAQAEEKTRRLWRWVGLGVLIVASIVASVLILQQLKLSQALQQKHIAQQKEQIAQQKEQQAELLTVDYKLLAEQTAGNQKLLA